ncbi:MAG: hypothetical protein DA408_06835 [Bacteroidetes bacterium]|nr:MAG: hypothetical protein DA408_06835 [Bacteroidota bacterium]
MLPVKISYPHFTANQVLASEHLNQLFAYLDEQERLTRANLIGIGIVCGLEPAIAAGGASMRISKGCGVTSEGYLIVWEDAAALEWYRPYSVPPDLPYREFEDRAVSPAQPFPMWELLPDRNNDANALPLSLDFIQGVNQPTGSGDEKVLVLFLECLAESNRNCSPNSCNDKGSTVTATIRPLLIRRQDMDKLQNRIRALGPEAEAYFSLSDTMSARLGLPTLKLPRYDVGATSLGSTTSVFTAFQRVLSQPVVMGVAAALTNAYQAFRPLLTDFPTNPFNNLNTLWAYLYNGSIETTNQYLWYQYFHDHLDIIIQAYDEFRLRGLEVLGLCCPDSRLFPRHLMLGNIGVTPRDDAYRHGFVPSPLFSRQLGAITELRLLFQRLVTLVQVLELPPNVNTLVSGLTQPVFIPFDTLTTIGVFNRVTNFTAFRPRLSTEIKITPSQLGKPLSQKAIPYHYQPVPLYQYWSYHLNRQGKARENLGYRSNSWNTTDLFVRYPLSYDLEPHNFLRIEGHLGQNYVPALSELISQTERNRLPIDVVALKTGYNSDTIPLPTELADCHFHDLEALYSAFREELRCQICETVKRLYNIPILPQRDEGNGGFRVPQLGLLVNCAPNFRYFVFSVGGHYEENLALHTSGGPFYGSLHSDYHAAVYFIFSLVQLAEVLPENLSQLDMTLFRQRYSSFNAIGSLINNILLAITNDALPPNPNNQPRIDWEELSDQLDNMLFACKLESFQRIRDEYQRRIDRIREGLLLSKFARQHPGLQHKAGVPLGGTFILVYHGEDQPDDIPGRTGRFTIRGRVVINGDPLPGVTVAQLGTTNGSLTDLDGNFQLIVTSLPARLEVSAAGAARQEILVPSETSSLVIDLANPTGSTGTVGRFANLAVGTVIADFYLPYRCCSDCEPIQFVLPKSPPTFSWEQVGCTNPNRQATVLIMPAGGTPPYDYSTNSGLNWNALGEEPLLLDNGTLIQLRDAEGTESVRRTIELLDPLVASQVDEGQCSEDGLNFKVPIAIIGGRPPYRLTTPDGTTTNVAAGAVGSVTFASGQGGEVLVQDSSNPACEARLDISPITCEQGCNLPCGGRTRECGYPFWMQRNPIPQVPYRNVKLEVASLSVAGEIPGQAVTFNGEQLGRLTEILNPGQDFPTPGSFTSFWSGRIAEANAFLQEQLGSALGSPDQPVLRLAYVANEPGGLTTLQIEHYDCHQFNFVINLGFFGETDKQSYQRQWQYSNAGVEVREQSELSGQFVSDTNGSLPPFNCVLRNRCTPDEPAVELCQNPRTVRITRENLGNNRYQFVVQPSATAEFPILWIVEHGLPAIDKGPQLQTVLPFAHTYDVRVIVVDPETTCASVARLAVNTQNR